MTNTSASPQKWHVGNWTSLGWLETGIKLIAHIVAFIALAWAFFPWDMGTRTTGFRVWPDVYQVRVLLLGVIALALTVAIVNRYLEKEIIAMIFIIINVAAHWAMVCSLLRQPLIGLMSLINYQPLWFLPWQLLPIFCALMLLGDVIKIVFLQRTHFTVRGYSTRALVYLTGAFVVGYALLLILSLFNPYIG